MTEMLHQNQEEEPQIDLREYWRIAIKRRWTILAVAVVALTLVTIFTLRQQKVYEAKASVIIEIDAPQVLGNVREVYNLGAGSYWSNKEYYETQYKVITSRTISQMVVNQLRLEKNYEFLGLDKLSPEEQAEALKEPLDVVDMVRSSLSAEPVKDSRMVIVKAEHTSPKWAKRLANTTVNAYITYNLQTRRKITEDAAGWLSDQAQELKLRLENSENRLHAFKADQKMLSVSLEDRQNITSQRLHDLNQTLNRIQTELDAMDSRRRQILAVRKSRQSLDSIDQVIDNRLIQQLKESYFKLKEEQADLIARYLEEHPKVKAINGKISVVMANIEREIDNVLVSIESNYQAKRKEEQQAKKRLATVKAEALEINHKALEYNRLKRSSDNASTLYNLVMRRQKEATLSALQETNNIYKLDPAILPVKPIYPRVKLNIMLAGVIGLLLGVALAFLLEFLDNTFKSQEDVERLLNVPFLGIIPSIKPEPGQDNLNLRDNYLVTHPKSNVAESCRTIRTNLLFMSPENPAKRLLVTSASPQEGKSTVCINLGVTMAQSGSKVVMLDTDMRRPRLHRSYRIKGGFGLTTAILGEASLDKVLHPSEVPGLDIIPCGPIPPNPTELFHTERFQKIVEELSERYDRVLFDSPPVLMVADPLILSNIMDGVIIVVKSAQTSSEMARRAVRQLTNVNAHLLGAVINDLDLSHRSYGYYYYRQYGYYYGEKENDSKG
jgi:capsular exopolysaccharide synthesis family protein